jgi:hypothetical protein
MSGTTADVPDYAKPVIEDVGMFRSAFPSVGLGEAGDKPVAILSDLSYQAMPSASLSLLSC